MRRASERTERAQRVEAEVHTETRTVPGGPRETEVLRQRANIPVEHDRVQQRTLEQPNEHPTGTSPTDRP